VSLIWSVGSTTSTISMFELFRLVDAEIPSQCVTFIHASAELMQALGRMAYAMKPAKQTPWTL
jgi:hypothetical protein